MGERVTFNDWIVSVISLSLQRINTTHGYPSLTEMTNLIPINMMPFPTKAKFATPTNFTSFAQHQLPILGSVEKNLTKFKGIMKKLSNPAALASPYYFGKLISLFLPSKILIMVTKEAFKPLDVVVSNVPGPREELVFDGKRVFELLVVG